MARTGQLTGNTPRHTSTLPQSLHTFFHRQGEQVKDFRKAWRKACRNAGIPDGRVFHDLRRTTARNLSRADMPDRIALSIMGHKTRAMYDRSHIVDEEDIRRGMRRAEDYLTAENDHPVTHTEK